MSIRLFARGITAALESRTLAGPVVQYGVPGRTSRGILKVRPGALYVVGDLSDVKLTKEHLRQESRGYAQSIDFLPEGIRASMRVADGPEGDDALREAKDKTRDGFSFDVIDEVIDGDEIVSGRIIAIGQVGIPAFDHMRIDTIAASLHTDEGASMTEEQRQRLAELTANQNRTPEEETEYQQLVALAVAEATAVQASADEPPADQPPADQPPADEPPADQPPADQPPAQQQRAGVAASMVPAVPGGQQLGNRGTPAARTQPRGSAFEQMISGLAAAFEAKRRGGNALTGITAALQDVTSTAHTGNIEPIQWQGELFDGVDFTPVFSDLLTPGNMENWEGQGWRVTSVPKLADWAGDKTEIPSGVVTTEKELWEAARASVGIDIDRKFFDFPNAAFLTKVFKEIALTWKEIEDLKARAWLLTEAVKATKTVAVHTTNADATVTAAAGTFAPSDVGASITGAGIPALATIAAFTNSGSIELSANATATADITATMDVQAPSLLKAAGRIALSLNRKGPDGSKAPSNTGAEYILCNDEDLFTLMDIDHDSLPAFLELFKVDPDKFRSDPSVPRGEVIGGVIKAGELLTPRNMPLEVDALNLALGGVDKAFFGYWAIQQHHKRGVQRVQFVQV